MAKYIFIFAALLAPAIFVPARDDNNPPPRTPEIIATQEVTHGACHLIGTLCLPTPTPETGEQK